MDDLLAAVGREDLAREVIVALDDADAAVADLDAPLDTVDAAKLTAAHTAVKTVADLLKSDASRPCSRFRCRLRPQGTMTDSVIGFGTNLLVPLVDPGSRTFVPPSRSWPC